MTSLEMRSETAGRLWSAYAAHPSGTLREQLIEQYRPLALAVLHQICRHPDEDLEQVAMLALVRAVDRYDRAKGNPFPAFAIPTIRGELRHYLRDQSRLVRCPRPLINRRAAVMGKEQELAGRLGRSPSMDEIAAALGISLDQVVEALAIEETCHPYSLDSPLPSTADNGPLLFEECLGAADPELERVEEEVAWQQELGTLGPQLRKVLQLRYYGNLSQRETAERMGVSQMHVSRLESQAAAKDSREHGKEMRTAAGWEDETYRERFSLLPSMHRRSAPRLRPPIRV